MKAIRDFQEFVNGNIVKKQAVDKSRAAFLMKESERSYHNLLDMIAKLTINDDNANDFIKSCHDILMECIRAKMLVEGYNASGQGAHEAEVSYLRILSFSEVDVQFADRLRFHRNGMLYYGTMLDKEYAEKVISFTKRMYPALKKMLNS